ncbi:MAG: glycosyltransferase [Dorea sp.]|nr:glycosyltransferase [Dorea sp.]
MVKVSLIIPVYNSGLYLRRCLDSVLGQTLGGIEVICVDDGSTDESAEILEEYASRHQNMQVIHQENRGVAAARKLGAAKAQGRYIGYVDSDDWVETDMFEKLYGYAVSRAVDLVTSGYFLEGDYITGHYDTVSEGLYQGERIKYLRNHTIYNLPQKETGLRATLCSKLFSRGVMLKAQEMVSDQVTISEDKLSVLAYILECQSVFVLKEAYYHYMIHSQSTVHAVNREYLVCVNEVYKCFVNLYQHPNFTDAMRQQAELYITELLLKGMNSLMGFQRRNLLWFDPYWLGQIPSGSKVVLYGAGEAGMKCRQQILGKGNLQYVGCVDFGYEKFRGSNLKVNPPETLKEEEYDYIVITIKNPVKAKQVKEKLKESGVEPGRILWFEQKELFWRYAEAEGMLKEEPSSDCGPQAAE